MRGIQTTIIKTLAIAIHTPTYTHTLVNNMQKPKQNKIWKLNNVMNINNQGFLFQGQLTTRLHTHRQILHKAQKIWKQDTHQNQNMSSSYVIMYLQGYVQVMWDIAHCPFSKIHLSMIESQKKP